MKEIAFFFVCSIYAINIVYTQCNHSPTTASGSKAPSKICSGQLIFEENFDNLDTSKWKHEETLSGGGNWEFEWYTADAKNSYVKNGILHIKPTLVADDFGNDFLYSGTIDLNGHCTSSEFYGCKRTGTSRNIVNPIKSARLNTVNSFSFKFGKVEIRAKLPAGDWLWPALWLLPTKQVYSSWPASGEIDMMESRGNKQLIAGGKDIGVKMVASTLHWGPKPDLNRFERTHWEKNAPNGYDLDFHKFQLEWTPDYLKFLVDDAEIGKVTPPSGGFWEFGDLAGSGLNNPWKNSKMAPFDQEFHFIINLAVGGTNGFFPDNVGGKPWSDKSDNAPTTFWEARNSWLPTWNQQSDNSHLKVDYIKVWAL